MVDTNGLPLVFDTTCLCHFAIADRIDVLGSLPAGQVCLTTTVVIEELKRGVSKYPQLAVMADQEWLTIERMDSSLSRLTGFISWANRIGSDPERDLGEASVMAVAEELGATAIMDDLSAKRIVKRYHTEVHGTLWLLAEFWRDGKSTKVGVCNLIDPLLDSGMRLPCGRGEFPDFARRKKLGPYRR